MKIDYPKMIYKNKNRNDWKIVKDSDEAAEMLKLGYGDIAGIPEKVQTKPKAAPKGKRPKAKPEVKTD